jgi:hypothetical protein
MRIDCRCGNSVVHWRRLIEDERAPYAASESVAADEYQRRLKMRLEDRIDAMLDHALEMTFPASDPFTIYFPEVETGDEPAEVKRDLELEVAA